MDSGSAPREKRISMSKLARALAAEPRATVRTGFWTIRATRSVRRAVRENPAVVSPPTRAPEVPSISEAGMLFVLRLSRQSCLVRAIVRQAWFHAQGSHRDLVIGVRRHEGQFEAHSWIDGDAPVALTTYREIARRAYGEALGRVAAGGE
jgi:Transglutaminase-like superfamily